MSRYFEYFPIVTHTDTKLINITLRGRITDFVRANPFVFLPYVVEDDMRAEDLSYHYYGSVDYTWLIYYANDIIDPYHQWPMTEENLHNNIMKKYYDEALHSYQTANSLVTQITDFEVLMWSMNDQITDNIVEYRHTEDELVNLSYESYLFNANNYLKPIYANTVVDPCNTMIEIVDSCNLLLEQTDLANTVLFEASKYEPIRVYDWEVEQNENRRHIQLVDRIYLPQIIGEFKESLNE